MMRIEPGKIPTTNQTKGRQPKQTEGKVPTHSAFYSGLQATQLASLSVAANSVSDGQFGCEVRAIV